MDYSAELTWISAVKVLYRIVNGVEVVLEAKNCPGCISGSYRDPFHDLSTLMVF